jgi:hypothetical protein
MIPAATKNLEDGVLIGSRGPAPGVEWKKIKE